MLRKKILTLLLLLTVTLSGLWGISPDCKRFALIIGSNNKGAMKSSADRNFTDNDTNALKEVLEGNCGYETMVLNGSCDKSKVLKILQDIACSQSLKSLIFCYSGYGFNYRKQPFFIFGDYDPQHPVATALSYDELFYYFRMINDRTHVMAFIDYAFAGMDGRSSLNTDEDFVTIQRERGIKVIMSGSPKPIVYKDYEKPRSVFSFFLTEGLRGEADIDANGTVTFGEISEYLVTSCRNYLVRNKYEKLYMPEIFADSQDGDFSINARSKQIRSEVTVRSERVSDGGLITFNERFNEAYNSEFGNSSERIKNDETKGLLTIIRTDFFDVKTFQPVSFFNQEDTGYVGLDIMLRLSRLPDPYQRIILSVYFYYPDGSLMCKLDKPCRPLNTPGMMNCRVLYGWDNPGHWQPGKYTVKIAYRDEVLSMTNFRVR